MTYDERIEQLYNEATKRAESRETSYTAISTECSEGYLDGIEAAFGDSETDRWLNHVTSESNYGFAFICGVMSALEAIKGKGYKASWQSEGELSALPNIKRKYDRLKAMQGTLPGTIVLDEARPTTAADLAVYATKLTTWFNEFDQEGFKSWIKEVQKLTQEGINARKETRAEGV